MTDDDKAHPRRADPRVFTWTSGSEVKPVQVDWWEHHLIPRGCLTLPVGRGNSGKSTTCAAWAAEASNQGEVVTWLHSEESRSMHIVPKLIAAGANIDLIKFLDVGVQMEDGTISEALLQLPRDIDRLEEDLVVLGCRFIVFDALTSFKPSKMSANSGDDVRAFLEPIQRMAGRLNAVVLGIAHLGKDGERKARDSVKGASEWTDVPRQVLAFHRDDGEVDGVISDVKGNLSPSPRSIGYRFENVALPEHGIDEVGRVIFTGDVDTNVDEARRSAAPDDDGDDRKESEIWLEDYLTENGETDSIVAKRDGAKALGVSTKTISRAATAIKVRSVPRGFPRKTFWSLATIVDGEVISEDSQDNSTTPITATVSSLVPTGDDQAKRNVPTGQKHSEDIPQKSVPTDAQCVDCGLPLPSSDIRRCGECELTASPEMATPRTLRVVAEVSDNVSPTPASSTAPNGAPSTSRPPTCLEWINNHVTGLLAAGIETVESKSVYDLGVEAGYRIDNLRQAAKKSDLISVAERRADTAVWRLGTGNENTAITCGQWLTTWLSEHKAWVKASSAYEAGQQSGYSRTAVKSAAQGSPHVLKRGKSIHTEWSIDPTHQEASAS